MNQSIIKKLFISIIFAVSFASVSLVNAATILDEIYNPIDSNVKISKVPFFFTTYNSVTEKLSFTSTIQKTNDPHLYGFWLVLSDSPNSNNHYLEYAIFYGDGITSNLTTYVFNGINIFGSRNWSGGFIESFAGELSVYSSFNNELKFRSSANLADINNTTLTYVSDWDAISFDESILTLQFLENTIVKAFQGTPSS
jgi:hypothetical protein